MKFSIVTDPKWVNAEHTQIDCVVDFEIIGVVPFTACQSDTAEHGREIFARAAAGEFGTVADYVPPATNNQTTAQSVPME